MSPLTKSSEFAQGPHKVVLNSMDAAADENDGRSGGASPVPLLPLSRIASASQFPTR